jgi:hypothetical protein
MPGHCPGDLMIANSVLQYKSAANRWAGVNCFGFFFDKGSLTFIFHPAYENAILELWRSIKGDER